MARRVLQAGPLPLAGRRDLAGAEYLTWI